MVSEVIKILRLISEEELVQDNYYGAAFNVCLELSKLDDILNRCDPERKENYY